MQAMAWLQRMSHRTCDDIGGRSSSEVGMDRLFIMLRSPSEYQDLSIIASLGGEGRIGIILFQDAVMFSVHPDRRDELLDMADEVFVMGNDLEARGFKGKGDPRFRVIGYPEAVDLIMEGYDLTITV